MKSTFFGRFQDWLSEWSDAKTRQVLLVVLAVMIGLLLGMLVCTIARYLIEQIWPFPPGLYELSDGVERQQLLGTVGIQVYLCTALSWIIGALGGGYCAARFAKLGEFPAWITGIVLAAYCLIDLLHRPHTILLFISCPIIVGAGAWAGGWLGMYVTMRKGLRAGGLGASAPAAKIAPSVSDTPADWD